jgi:hypothetical protein
MFNNSKKQNHEKKNHIFKKTGAVRRVIADGTCAGFEGTALCTSFNLSSASGSKCMPWG